MSRFRAVSALVAACWLLSIPDSTYAQAAPPPFEAYLRRSVVDKKTLDFFLDPKQLSGAKFDPITGYRLGNYMPNDGLDRSSRTEMARACWWCYLIHLAS